MGRSDAASLVRGVVMVSLNSLPGISQSPLSQEELSRINAYWRAANYLSVGQIYLYANPLLREPLKLEHIKPRLLGHWGTTPGLNFIYVHFNRIIKKYDLNAIYIAGPGHGGPGMVANAYLEGTYSELYPNIRQNEDGIRALFKQFSFPGGIPSHAAPETPGSIHEGGELGYSLSHACGAAFDNPDLLVCCVVGDGEAETGPLATSWHINKFLNPVRDGAVLPILHLNGYKIANPTVLGRMTDDELSDLFIGYGWKPYFLEGHEPELDLLVCCVVGDGEAETGPLATSWHINKFLNPVRDGAVLPILHLNGYKIANPTVLGRMTDDELSDLFIGYGWKPYFLEGHEPE